MPRDLTARALTLAWLGLLAAVVTLFQLTLSRPRNEWIAVGLSEHELVMHGSAGNPWQYRILSDYGIQGLFDVLVERDVPNPYLVGFVLVRGAQACGIFSLFFVYLRALGFRLISGLVGSFVLCVSLVGSQIQTNWRLDTYTELVLYLGAAYMVRLRRVGLKTTLPLTVLAALNRETGVLVALLPIAQVTPRTWISRENAAMYRTVIVSIVCFAAIRVLLLLVLPSQELSTRVVTDELVGSFRDDAPYPQLAIGLGSLPVIAAFGLACSGTFLTRLFWLIVPVWSAVHASSNVAMESIAWLVPLALVFVPCGLRLAEGVLRRSEADWAAFAGRGSVLAAIFASYLLGPLIAALVRLTYAFPLERLEPAVLQEVRRISTGQSLYAPPTLEYVPTLYAPLYFYVSAALATLTGTSFMPLRLVSLAAAVGAAALIYRMVAADAPGRLAGFLAAALFLGSAQLTPVDRYPGRVDLLCLVLLLAAFYCARQADRLPTGGRARYAAAGLFAALAMLTKQTAMFGVCSLAIAVALHRPRATNLLWLLSVGPAVLAAATTFLFWTSGGWARFYLIDLPRNHGYDWSNLVGFWTTTMLPNFGLAAPFVLVFLVATDGRRPGTTAFYGLMAGGLIAMSWVSLLNIGGAPNSLPPAYAGLALLFGLGVQPTLRRCERRRLGPFQTAPLVLVLMALALGRLEYVATDPAPLAPNARAGQRLVQAIAALPGPVFAPDFGEFQHQAGKGDQAHTTNYQELLGFYGGAVLPEGRQWLNDLEAALAARRFAYVLVDPEGSDQAFTTMLDRNGYARRGRLMPEGDPFYLWAIGQTSGRGHLTPAPDVYVPRSFLRLRARPRASVDPRAPPGCC